jgi:hypothetical protein
MQNFVGAVLLLIPAALAAVFMLWVLWKFWNDTAR